VATQTHSEKDAFIQRFDQEYRTHRRVLEGYPPDQLDLKPGEKSKPARDVAWMLVLNQMVMVPIAKGEELKPGSFPKSTGTLPEMITALDQHHVEAMRVLRESDESVWNQSLTMPVGPKQMGQMKRSDALWFFFFDAIHHRGQLTVYSRIAGGKVPSIYGPTADEPWS